MLPGQVVDAAVQEHGGQQGQRRSTCPRAGTRCARPRHPSGSVDQRLAGRELARRPRPSGRRTRRAPAARQYRLLAELVSSGAPHWNAEGWTNRNTTTLSAISARVTHGTRRVRSSSRRGRATSARPPEPHPHRPLALGLGVEARDRPPPACRRPGRGARGRLSPCRIISIETTRSGHSSGHVEGEAEHERPQERAEPPAAAGRSCGR